jgi:autotransporter-associated beta strand protein
MRLPIATLRAAVGILSAPLGLGAADVIKANNTNTLNLGTSWVDGAAPTTSDIAVFDSTYATTGALNTGALVTWGGLRIANPAGAVAINNTSSGQFVALGSSGIDMSAATVNASIQRIRIDASQTWNIASGREFKVGNSSASTARVGQFTVNANGYTVTKTGGGTVQLDTGNANLGLVNWRFESGLVRAIWNNSSAWGTGNLTLAGGGIAVGTSLAGSVGNWTWNNAMTLENGTASFIDNQNIGGDNRWLLLMGAMSGSGDVEFRDTGSGFNNSNYGFIIGSNNTNTGTVTIAANAEVRVGSSAASGSANTGNVGKLAADSASIVTNGVLSFSRLDTHTVANAISGTGQVRVGLTTAIGTSTATQNVTFSGNLSQTGAFFVFNGSSTLTGSNNTHSGGTELQGGTLTASGLENAGGAGSIGTGYLAIKGGSTFNYTGGSVSTARSLFLDNGASNFNVTDADAVVSWSDSAAKNGAFTKGGAGTLALSGAFTTGASVTVSGGTLSLAGANTYTGGTSIAAGATLEIAGSGSLANTAITGLGALRMAGTGTLTLSSTSNSYTGGTTVAGGTLALGAAGVLADSGAVTVSGGTLDLGAFAETVGSLALASGTIQNGTLTSSADIQLTGGTVAASAVLAGSVGLAKTGAGSATLSGSHTYTGATAVTGGTLVLTTGASLASNAYVIGDGATFQVADGLSLGTGKTLSLGTTLAPASASLAGNLSLAGGALNLAFGESDHDELAVAGDLDLASGAIAFSKAGSYAGGTYDLVAYTGSLTGSADNLSISGLSSDGTSRQTFALLNDSVNKLIQLEVGGQAETVLWTGANGAAWNAGGTGSRNWSVTDPNYTGDQPDRFFNGDSVVFDDTASTGTVEVDAAGIVAGAITVSANTLDYTLGGSGLITAGALAKSGSATLTVANANTYNGGTTLSAGRIRLGTSDALGSGILTLAGGRLSSDGSSGRSLANAVVLSGNAALGDATDTGELTLSGAVDLGGTRALEVLSNVVLSGIVSNGALEKTGAGLLTLSGANTYVGGTTVAAGTLALGAAGVLADSGAVTVAGGTLDLGAFAETVGSLALASGTIQNGTLTSSADIQLTGGTVAASAVLAGSVGLAKTGAGSATLSGANTYTGATTVSAGTLELGHASALGTTAAGTTVASGATLDLKGLAIGAEALALAGTLANSSATAASLSGAVTLSSGATIAATGNLTLSSAVGVSGAGFTKTGAGILELTAAASLTGAVTVSEGTLRLSSNGAIASSSGVTIASGATLDWARSATFGVGVSGAGTFRRSTSGNAPITGGANNAGFTGTWEVTASGGYLGFVGDASLGDTSANLSLSGGGGIYFTAGGNTLAATRTVTLGAGGGALNGSTGNTNTFAAKFTGTGNLSKVSGETAVLTHPDNDFTGNISISGGGTLEIGGAGRLGEGAYAGTISNPNTLRFSTSADQTLSGAISGAGTLQKSGTGTLTLSATNTHSGNVTVSGGVLEIAPTGQIFAGTYTNAATVTVSGGATLRLASFAYDAAGGLGRLADYGARRLLNGGGIEVTGNSHSTGNNFQVANGATGFLNVTTSGQTLTLAGNANDNIALGGALTVGGAGNLTINEIIGNNTGAGSILKSGAGTLTLGAANTFSGGVALSDGALVVGHVSGLGSGTVSVAGGSLDLGGLAVANAITLSGGSLSNAAAYAGALTLGGNASVGGTVGGIFGTGTDVSRVVTLSGGAASFTGTLKGVGTLDGDVTLEAGALHAPGNSPGLQTIDGDLAYADGASVQWELEANTDSGRGTSFDGIDVTGNLTLGPVSGDSVNLSLVFAGTVDWADSFWDADRSWLLYDVGGAIANFSNLQITAGFLDASGDLLSDVRGSASFGLQEVGSEVRITYSAVPEPSTYGLILGGLALAGAALRRRRKF